jgi:hypothetical protein
MVDPQDSIRGCEEVAEALLHEVAVSLHHVRLIKQRGPDASESGASRRVFHSQLLSRIQSTVGLESQSIIRHEPQQRQRAFFCAD